MLHPDSAPTRSLPHKPSLPQLRKQAKELRKSYQAGQLAAVAEVERFERSPGQASFTLVDAQRVLARSYGFPSWKELKQHVDGLNVKALCEAADAGDVATVRKLAKARPELVDIERSGEFGESIALHFAVLNRDGEMTRTLMELGSNARKGIWPHRDATAAYTIAKERGYDEIVAIIEQEEERRRKELSSPGATVSSTTEEIQKAILDDRCDEAIRILENDLSLVGACNDKGATPLHVAAWAHNTEMAAWLLDRQASVDAQDASGRTPLDYAAIVAGWSANDRYVPFLENARIEPERFYETVRLLRSKGAELAPRAAVAIGDQQALLQMHREGRLNNKIDFFRGGLLSIAVRVNRADLVSLLFDLGLDPDESATRTTAAGRDRSWGMPLWFAAAAGRHEIAELLLARGADVNAVVYACGDALCNAHESRDEKMKALLLEHGARITVEHVAANRDRETAKAILDGTMSAQSLNVDKPSHTDLAEQLLWSAAFRGDSEIVRMCLPHMQRKPDDPWWNYVLAQPLRFSNHSPDSMPNDLDRSTFPVCFKLILEHGVDPDVVGRGGHTILHHLATVDIMDQERLTFATIQLDAGASLDKREPLLQSTPLGWACRWGRMALVELYLERGADALEPEAEPWATPLAWATKGGHRGIVELLGSHGPK